MESTKINHLPRCSISGKILGKREPNNQTQKPMKKTLLLFSMLALPFAAVGEDGNADTKDKLAEAKARQNSMANRAITAASVAGMGIGTSQLMQGMAERGADDKWSQEIENLVKSINCGIQGQARIQGGEEGWTPTYSAKFRQLREDYIGVPGLKVGLAPRLKELKEELGLRPGIESELVMDTERLYGNDAIIGGDEWTGGFSTAEERSEAGEGGSRMRTGAIVAGAGAAVGIGGNLLVNTIKPNLGAGDKAAAEKQIAQADKDREACRGKCGAGDTNCTKKCDDDRNVILSKR